MKDILNKLFYFLLPNESITVPNLLLRQFLNGTFMCSDGIGRPARGHSNNLFVCVRGSACALETDRENECACAYVFVCRGEVVC